VKANSYSVIPDITYIFRDWDVTGHKWSQKKFNQFTRIFIGQLDAVNKGRLDAGVRIKYKKKAFWFRLAMARYALQTPDCIRPYINRFLSPSFLTDRDTLHDGLLFLGYFISIMPLAIKVVILKCHIFLYDNKGKFIFTR
jgi:hypothetical protein